MMPMDLMQEDDVTKDLIQGSSKPTTKEKPFSDPLRHVDRSREHRTKSVSELVKSASEVCEAIDAARNEPELLARVLSKLVDIKMISGAEAAKAEIAKMSTISKYRKIDQRREVLLHPNVANKICSGPTILYELSLLVDNMPDEDDAAEQLGKYLETLDGPLTRKWVQDLREKIAPKKRRKKKATTAVIDKFETVHPIEEDQGEQVEVEEITDDMSGSDDEFADCFQASEPMSATISMSEHGILVMPNDPAADTENGEDTASSVKEPKERIGVLLATPSDQDVLNILSGERDGCRCMTLDREIGHVAVLLIQGNARAVLSIGRAVG